MRPSSARAPRRGRRCSSTSRSFTIGSACTRPWDTEPRPRLAPAWRPSPYALRRDILIYPLHTKGGGPAGDAPQPVHGRTLPASEPRGLPLRPFPESLVEGAEHLNAPRAIEPPVVVQPAPHHRVRKASQTLQALVVPGGRHPPAADGLPDRRRGLGADRRQEADEVSPPPVLRPSRLEGVAEEVERDVFILPRPVVVLAVDDPGLRGMKLQTAFRQATPDRLQHSPRLRLAPAMDERSSRGGDLHPSALPEPDVRLSPHPAPTLQPPAARPAATGRTGRDRGGRCAPASASPHVPGAGTACTSAAPISREPHSRDGAPARTASDRTARSSSASPAPPGSQGEPDPPGAGCSWWTPSASGGWSAGSPSRPWC